MTFEFIVDTNNQIRNSKVKYVNFLGNLTLDLINNINSIRNENKETINFEYESPIYSPNITRVNPKMSRILETSELA